MEDGSWKNNLHTASFYKAGNWGWEGLSAADFKPAGITADYLTFPQDGDDRGYKAGINCELWENGPATNPYLANADQAFQTTLSNWVCHDQDDKATAKFTGVDNIQCQYDNEPWNVVDARKGATPIVNPTMKGYYFGLFFPPAGEDWGCGQDVEIVKGNQYDVCGNLEIDAFWLCPCDAPPCGL